MKILPSQLASKPGTWWYDSSTVSLYIEIRMDPFGEEPRLINNQILQFKDTRGREHIIKLPFNLDHWMIRNFEAIWAYESEDDWEGRATLFYESGESVTRRCIPDINEAERARWYRDNVNRQCGKRCGVSFMFRPDATDLPDKRISTLLPALFTSCNVCFGA